MTSTEQVTSGSVPVLQRIVISTNHLDRALTFYRDVLGLVGPPRDAAGVAMLATGSGTEVMLHERETEPSDTAVAAGFAIAQLDAVIESWASLGGEIVDPPATQAWGERMAVVRDADGHLVCLIDADVD